MSDLIEQLRDTGIFDNDTIRCEAADEIERLTAEHKKLLAQHLAALDKVERLTARVAELESAAIVERDSINARFDENVKLIKADEKLRMKIERLHVSITGLKHDNERYVAINGDLATENRNLSAEVTELRGGCTELAENLLEALEWNWCDDDYPEALRDTLTGLADKWGKRAVTPSGSPAPKWTQEEIDTADAKAKDLHENIIWDDGRES